jgi:hypothetical protein
MMYIPEQSTSVSESEYAKEVWEDESPAVGVSIPPPSEEKGKFKVGPRQKNDVGQP